MKVLVTINVHAQLKAVEIEAAAPRIRLGNISPIISQGIGPKPIKWKMSNKILHYILGKTRMYLMKN